MVKTINDIKDQSHRPRYIPRPPQIPDNRPVNIKENSIDALIYSEIKHIQGRFLLIVALICILILIILAISIMMKRLCDRVDILRDRLIVEFQKHS